MAEREFLLPDLGEGLEEAEIVQWLVAEGDEITLNQPLVEVNTAKALVEIPSPLVGKVVTLHGAEGEVVFVGKPLVTIEVEGAAPASEGRGSSPAEKPKRTPVLVGYGVEEEEPTAATAPAARAKRAGKGGPVPASPPVRRLAKELGVDLSTVTGSGPDGRVTREDVEKAAEGTAGTSPAPRRTEGEERSPVRGTRRLIAEKMARSAREIPHVTTFLTLDAFHLDGFRRELQDRSGERISPLPVVVRALVETCREHRKLNASFDADRSELVLHASCNVGIATDTERGLMVPVVRAAETKGIIDLAREISMLSQRAREGTSSPEELVGSTITVTNVGSFGAEYGTPIINYPEAAVLAVGVMEPRALVVDGEVLARPAMTLSLSFDHRLLDGAEAGRALRDLADRLESPDR